MRRFAMGSCGLLHRAKLRIEPGRAFKVRSAIAQPCKAAVVHVRVDGGDGATVSARCSRQLRAPRLRAEIGENELIHRIVDGVSFDEDGADVVDCGRGLRGRWHDGCMVSLFVAIYAGSA